MYLKSLTIRGFKSFASATELNFEPGITCIVGPNGSGKSNVVDALSWVMGEQGAKSLRGGKMEDVIFAGTSSRAPLGRAEVQLTIDNTDGVLPIEYSEVTISRTLFRNGGSEYAINGSQCRLLDVQELLSDTGMGNEMHVIVGQGQLDQVLHATPETRRGFIEEAAGIYKHRKRKEKALRKLDSTQANVDRLKDLISEIRRQLKPLGRQAEVARKASIIQAELRDAKSRILADDLTQVTLALETDLESELAAAEARKNAETDLEAARFKEVKAEQRLNAASPALTQAQENWYTLSALRERVSSTLSIAAERLRNAEHTPEPGRQGRDPEALEAEAKKIRDEENQLRQDVQNKENTLSDATLRRNSAEHAHGEAEKHYSAQLRAVADRREGLARLVGQVNSKKSKLEATADEVERLAARRDEARAKAEQANRDFALLESSIAGLDAGEVSLDAEYEEAETKVEAAQAKIDSLKTAEQELAQSRASLAARVEALALGLEQKDGSSALLAADEKLAGILGSVAALISVESGWETAVGAALGQAADAVAVADVSVAVDAVNQLKSADLGRAGMLLGGAPSSDLDWPNLEGKGRYLVDVIDTEESLQPALSRLLHKVVGVDDLESARSLVSGLPDVIAVTREGDLLSSWFAQGGSSNNQSLIEIQAAHDQASQELIETQHELDKLRFELAKANTELEKADDVCAAALERLHESDAQMAAVAEQLGNLGQAARVANAEAERLETEIEQAKLNRVQDEEVLASLEERLALASDETEVSEPDPTARDEAAEAARVARQAEMDARLALRTAEERVKALAGRADSLFNAARRERESRAKAAARAEQLRREAEDAKAVQAGAQILLAKVNLARDYAAVLKTEAEQERAAAQVAADQAHQDVREKSQALEQLVAGAHRDEVARIELKMRAESLAEKAMTELGMDSETLMAEFGPDKFVPVITKSDGTPLTEADEPVEPQPYVREVQEKRLRKAERDLQVLGRVNPLALEEFDAMQERHAFLAEQLEDVNQTRKDLLAIVDEVDARVEDVFGKAYQDVAATFEQVFTRLFPGGQGKLILTDPTDILTTGVDVEAKPAGKKLKRLSLLSGGERSLVAIAFLMSLFIARPSPFYILDEVEAALDDVNLGRLLSLYEQLRENSQLLIITHQKRTMEIADALYGMTMRDDGVTTVISQRTEKS